MTADAATERAGAEDARLILAIAERADRAAFARLFEKYAPRVKSYLLRQGAPAETAEELAQETLLTVWRKAALFDPARAGASTWIFTIARNRRLDVLRRERRPVIEPGAEEAADEPLPDALLAAAQRDARLRAAVAALPPDQAEAVRLAYFQDKPHAEIAQELGLPLGTVKSRLRLALARLRAAAEVDAPRGDRP